MGYNDRSEFKSGNDDFVEYWMLVRGLGSENGDGYLSPPKVMASISPTGDGNEQRRGK
jgi:hypothetical protein